MAALDSVFGVDPLSLHSIDFGSAYAGAAASPQTVLEALEKLNLEQDLVLAAMAAAEVGYGVLQRPDALGPFLEHSPEKWLAGLESSAPHILWYSPSTGRTLTMQEVAREALMEGAEVPSGAFLRRNALKFQIRETWALRKEVARVLREFGSPAPTTRSALTALVERVGRLAANTDARPELVTAAMDALFAAWTLDRGLYFRLVDSYDSSEFGMDPAIALNLELQARVGRHAFVVAPEVVKALPPKSEYETEPSVGWFVVSPWTEVPADEKLTAAEATTLLTAWCALPKQYVTQPLPASLWLTLPGDIPPCGSTP